ncbi:hypothetical protein [Pelosinus sp. UFO1]|uniref:hypothetical protein n=1 Tax=Pelosinus sp. UFO1 TaxID=484770 RepID=UPI000A4541AD|nr:hypothetical protein [Pelosinus sp. UFO1]
MRKITEGKFEHPACHNWHSTVEIRHHLVDRKCCLMYNPKNQRYAKVPGNVGEENTLKEVVEILLAK